MPTGKRNKTNTKRTKENKRKTRQPAPNKKQSDCLIDDIYRAHLSHVWQLPVVQQDVFLCYRCKDSAKPLLLMLCDHHYVCSLCVAKQITLPVSLHLKIDFLDPSDFRLLCRHEPLPSIWDTLCCNKVTPPTNYTSCLLKKNLTRLALERFHYGDALVAPLDATLRRLTDMATLKPDIRTVRCIHCEVIWTVPASQSSESQCQHSCINFTCNLCDGALNTGETWVDHANAHRVWSLVDEFVRICIRRGEGNRSKCLEMLQLRCKKFVAS